MFGQISYEPTLNFMLRDINAKALDLWPEVYQHW